MSKFFSETSWQNGLLTTLQERHLFLRAFRINNLSEFDFKKYFQTYISFYVYQYCAGIFKTVQTYFMFHLLDYRIYV